MRSTWTVALLGTLLLAGCTSTALRQARSADVLRDFDLAVVRYTEAVRRDPGSVEAQTGLQRARLRGSEAHHLRGRRLAAQGRFDDAVLELQVAVELNPTNADAAKDLQAARVAQREALSRPAGDRTALEDLLARAAGLRALGPELTDVKLPGAITTGRTTTSGDVYRMLGALLNLSISFDPAFRETPAQLTLQSDLTLREALVSIGRSTGTFVQVASPTSLIVVNDTPTKRREYAQEAERMIIVQNADLKESIDALRIVNDARTIAPMTGINAILLKDTPERIEAAYKFVQVFDKARPEVVIDVEVIEVDRSTFREYGAQLASPGSPGIDGVVDANREGGLSLADLSNLGRADILTSGLPALYYRLLKTDARTRTLANPHMRITDGVAATFNFGEEVPVPQTVIQPIQQGGLQIQPQTTFNYQTVGVNIGITPRTHPNDEITLLLNIELSTLAGTGFGGLPSFGKRAVSTTIRLRDGETNVLAGLIRDDERTTKESIPGLGDLPILGSLFARNRREAEQTDVIIMLTPHVVRGLALTEDDLRPLMLPRDATGAALIETPPIVPTPPIIRGSGGGGSEVGAGHPAPLASFPVQAGAPEGMLPSAPLVPPAPKVIKN